MKEARFRTMSTCRESGLFLGNYQKFFWCEIVQLLTIMAPMKGLYPKPKRGPKFFIHFILAKNYKKEGGWCGWTWDSSWNNVGEIVRRKYSKTKQDKSKINKYVFLRIIYIKTYFEAKEIFCCSELNTINPK